MNTKNSKTTQTIILMLLICGITYFNAKSICRYFIRDFRYSVTNRYLGESDNLEFLSEHIVNYKDSLRIFSFKHKHNRASGYSLLLGTLIQELYPAETILLFPSDQNKMTFFRENYVRCRLTSFYAYPVSLKYQDYYCILDQESFESLSDNSFYSFKAPLASFYFLKETRPDQTMAVYIYDNNLLVAPFTKDN